jgi:hypothetical protein
VVRSWPIQSGRSKSERSKRKGRIVPSSSAKPPIAVRQRISQHFTSKQRTREYRARKRLGLWVRPVRVSRKVAQKLVELGYISLDSKGDKRAEAFAIEAYLADSLS